MSEDSVLSARLGLKYVKELEEDVAVKETEFIIYFNVCSVEKAQWLTKTF